jgi:SAM-dependent methyltransferase
MPRPRKNITNKCNPNVGLTEEKKQELMEAGDFTFAHNDGNEDFFSGKERLSWGNPWQLSNAYRYMAACTTASRHARHIGKVHCDRDTTPPYYILDVGCSSGTLAKFWSTSFNVARKPRCAILGLEIDPNRVERALEFANTLKGKSLNFDVVEHDLVLDSLIDVETEHTEFGREFSPDCINAQEVIEHIGKEAAERFLDEAREILAPGGILIISTPAPRKEEGQDFVWAESHAYEFSRAELRNLVQYHGWSIKQEMGWFGNGEDILKRANPEQKKLYKELSSRLGSGIAVPTIATIYPELATCQQLVLEKM